MTHPADTEHKHTKDVYVLGNVRAVVIHDCIVEEDTGQPKDGFIVNFYDRDNHHLGCIEHDYSAEWSHVAIDHIIENEWLELYCFPAKPKVPFLGQLWVKALTVAFIIVLTVLLGNAAVGQGSGQPDYLIDSEGNTVPLLDAGDGFLIITEPLGSGPCN